MSKAIIGISDYQGMKNELAALATRLDNGENVPATQDYHLNFASASQFFLELTPRRMQLLEYLKTVGKLSIYALAKSIKRNYSNVYNDIAHLLILRLVAKDEKGFIFVPWDEIDIHVSIGITDLAA